MGAMTVSPNASFRAEFALPHVAKTEALARATSLHLTAGDTVLLSGPVGAGKSLFARTIIQSLQSVHGPVEDVPSPTFTLVQTYHAGPLEIWHVDLYRLSDANEVLELGLTDAFATALCLIEWPDRLAHHTPQGALSVAFSLSAQPGFRKVILSASDPKWQKLAAIAPHSSAQPVARDA